MANRPSSAPVDDPTATFVPGPSQDELTALMGDAPADMSPTDIEDVRPAEPPKRGRGRPKGSRTRRFTTPTRAASPTTNLTTRIATQLVTINLALMLIPPLRVDVLSEQEITALAQALNAQAQQSAQFKKYLELALSVGSSGELISIAGAIAVRRMARHGVMVPPETDPMIGSLMFNEPQLADASQ